MPIVIKIIKIPKNDEHPKLAIELDVAFIQKANISNGNKHSKRLRILL